MKMTITKACICKQLDDMEIEDVKEFINYYIERREGLKGYCRT